MSRRPQPPRLQPRSRADSVRPVLGGLVVVFLTLLTMASLKSWRDLQSERAHERQLERRIEETHASIDKLRRRISRLRDDPGLLERLARGELGMVRPDDVIVELPRAACPAGRTCDALGADARPLVH